ncbi:adenylyl-sulfate kinase [Metapseudomonas resinovorans]|uniref:Adenylyl-sulfate kinase n=1 Tax=Metapseudomonas resinovorans NBRC 106553 TaxID=1245471 RepID=S6BEF0_METRE|nr:adenylyl-sulfate kinase [Pseudomonas resinovorans]BAN47424.1 adenylyl-sulfate kinase [Pseudomonas resinovorans NBRC 106553]
MGKRESVTWQTGSLSLHDRLHKLGQVPMTLWFTGLSGAGKSTLAFRLERLLVERDILCVVLDGDNLRHGLCQDLGFDAESRAENIRRVAEVARLMNDAGLTVLAAFISPLAADRTLARQIVGAERFHEVFVNSPLHICEGRDPKGLYKKARRGELEHFTGIDAPYEPPLQPAIRLDTSDWSIETCLGSLMAEVQRYRARDCGESE